MRSIDLHFEELEKLIEYFGVNKPSLVCCSDTWMVESSAEDHYVLDNYAPMKFKPGKTRNEGVAIYVHESLSFEIIKFGTGIDLNYIAISCTNLKKEKNNVVCLYNSPSVNKQYLEHFELLLESCCQLSYCFLVGDMIIDLLETSAIGNKYLYSLKMDECYQGIKEPMRVTPTSKSFLDHIVHNDCLSNLEFEVIKINFTDHCATYVHLDITRSQSIRFQQSKETMPFLRNGYHKEKYLNYLRHFLDLSKLEQDVDRFTESLADALTTAVNVLTFEEEIKL